MQDCRSRSAGPAASHPPRVAGTRAATPGGTLQEPVGSVQIQPFRVYGLGDLGKTWGRLGDLGKVGWILQTL